MVNQRVNIPYHMIRTYGRGQVCGCVFLPSEKGEMMDTEIKTDNTKGAIEFCKDLKEVEFKYCKKIYDLNPHINNIIVLLQRGERDRIVKQKLKNKARACSKDDRITAKAKQMIRKIIYQQEDYYKKYLKED